MKTCPFCAEEIKNEAIKCKHCGSVMPEVHQKVVVEQANQAIAEQREIAVMDANWARNNLNISYLFIFVGLALSFEIMIYGKADIGTHKLAFMMLSLILIYAFWSMYWGVQIVYDPIKQWYSGLIVFESNITNLIIRQVVIVLGMYIITIPLAGLIVGALGGGIIRSLKCVAIANNSLVLDSEASSQADNKQAIPIESSKVSQGDGAINPFVAWSILGGGVLLLLVVCYFIMRN